MILVADSGSTTETMILVADSGSTKADWCLITGTGLNVYFETEGSNSYFINKEDIASSLSAKLPREIQSALITEVSFYGAGCDSSEGAQIVKEALSLLFPDAQIFVEVDTLAAARALLGRQAGFVSILGTGANTCLYDGDKITANIDPLGFILGDEGSGGSMGKKLLAEYLRGFLPDDLHAEFKKDYPQSYHEMMRHVYNMPFANKYCAAYTKFLSKTIDHPYSKQFVNMSFREFFNKLVSRYPSYQTYSFNCVGSIGYAFRDILQAVCEEFGMNMGLILVKPIEGLIRYHETGQLH